MVNRTPQLFLIGDVSHTSGQNVKFREDVRGSVCMGTERVTERDISSHNVDTTQEHLTCGHWRLEFA